MDLRHGRRRKHKDNEALSAGASSIDATSVRRIVKSTARSLEQALASIAKDQEAAQIVGQLRLLAHKFAAGEIEAHGFRDEFTQAWCKLNEFLAQIFDKERTVAMMEQAREHVCVARHMIHKYQRAVDRAALADVEARVMTMVAMFEDGSVHRLRKCGREVLALMEGDLFQTDERLACARSSVRKCVEELGEIQALFACKRTIESLKSDAERELAAVLSRRKPRGASPRQGQRRRLAEWTSTLSMSQAVITDVCDGNPLSGAKKEFVFESVVDYDKMGSSIDRQQRISELKSKNLWLKSMLAEARMSISSLEISLSKGSSQIFEEKTRMKQRSREAVKLKQSVLMDTLKGELLDVKNEIMKYRYQEEQKRKELELLGRMSSVGNRKVLMTIHEMGRDAQLLQLVIDLQRGFERNDVNMDMDQVLTDVKDEIATNVDEILKGKVCYRLGELEARLDEELDRCKTATSEYESKLDECADAGRDLTESVPDADDMNIRQLQNELKHLVLVRDVATLTREKIAQQDLETVRFQTLERRTKAKGTRKAKLLARLCKRGQGGCPEMISELQRLKQNSEAYFATFGNLEKEYESKIGRYYELFDRRVQAYDAEDILHIFHLSEKWDELVHIHIVHDVFLRSSSAELKELGKLLCLQFDGESLSDTYAKILNEMDQVLATAYADPETERYDTRLKELRALQKENKELTASISSMLTMAYHAKE